MVKNIPDHENKIINPPIMHVVHCIDTEGPMTESLNDTFLRIKQIFGINIKPTKLNLKKLQDKKLELSGLEENVAKVVSSKLLKYNQTWSDIREMLNDCMSHEFRTQMKDDYGNGWVYSWHCMDHVGYSQNPRKKDLGFGKVYQFYKNMIELSNSLQDEINWHYHPLSFDRNPLKSSSNYVNSFDVLNQVLCRRIIDEKWFPTVNRPGFHTERPDIHLFLEQWIPFDYANNSYDYEDGQDDLKSERFGDWRRASNKWYGYHPHHDDHQISGNCRRVIFRCLNVGTRFKNIKEKHVIEALNDAQKNGVSILAFANHDWRDIRPDVEYIRDIIDNVKENYSDVKIKFSGANEAAQHLVRLKEHRDYQPLKLNCYLEKSRFIVEVSEGELFGPQPYLAIQTKIGSYHHDNFDIIQPGKIFSYTLDFNTISLAEISIISAASSDKFGNYSVVSVKRKF
tara:strand:- start:61 stop:1422 length:1362 start_codon:yes stop_codon:yes gene_type:complete